MKNMLTYIEYKQLVYFKYNIFFIFFLISFYSIYLLIPCPLFALSINSLNADHLQDSNIQSLVRSLHTYQVTYASILFELCRLLISRYKLNASQLPSFIFLRLYAPRQPQTAMNKMEIFAGRKNRIPSWVLEKKKQYGIKPKPKCIILLLLGLWGDSGELLLSLGALEKTKSSLFSLSVSLQSISLP